jgi:cytoskeletal protein CcmA (bactofilin family)
MKRLFVYLAGIIAILVPIAALAFSTQVSHVVTLSKGQTQSGTYYAAGQVVTIDGDVNGDLICGGNTITVNGSVSGDVICAGQTITINGPVGGSVRLAGQVVNVNNTVARNGTIAAQTFNLGSSGSIAGDLGLLSQTASVDGPVTEGVYGAMQLLSLQSSVGSVHAYLGSLNVGPTATIHGNLNYTSDQTFNVNKSQVSGSIVRTAPPHHASPSVGQTITNFVIFGLYFMVAGIVIGLVLLWLAPRLIKRVVENMRSRPGASVGWGAVVTLIGPLLFILLFITVIAIPLGLLAAAIWGLMLVTSSIFSGIATGTWLLERMNWNKESWIWATVIGIPVLGILVSIPFLGFFIGIVSTFWAVGGLGLSSKALRS